MLLRLILMFVPSIIMAQLKVPDWVSVESNISYAPYKDTVLDVYRSKRATGAAKQAGVLVIHGGGWVDGTKESIFEILCLPYLEKGLVVVNVEYRQAAAAPAPAAVLDALTAAEWFRTNAAKYGVDKNKIIVTGGSAGGHLALMVAMAPKQAKLGPVGKVAAVVNFYGITDVQDQLEGQNMRKYAVAWLPPTLPDRQELARRVSPITWVRKDLPPVITIHGDADTVVPYEHGVDITKALRAAGNTAELIAVPHGGHGNFGPEKLAELYRQVFTFLEKRKIL